MCTHISIEPFHLFRYLDAECSRFNNRKTDDGERFLYVLGHVEGKRLMYKSLIGEGGTESHATSANDGANVGFDA